ncbi:MAG: molecular chaperone [Sphingobacteriaceae bacterium]|nr:MAG: molecular chaperone [Sphingobacteriaceae bacterium]
MGQLFLRSLFSGILFLSFFKGNAQGDLLITPKRLVFDGSKRAEEINLANIGKDTMTYTISFVQYKMDDNGLFVPIAENDSTHKFAHKNLRFFPRTVTLAPNEAQSVKVQLIKANELAAGEYRSHLFFKNTLNNAALGEERKTAPQDSGISVNLKPVFGISIATIVRVGEGNGTVGISDLKFNAASDPSVNFTLNRSGNFSVYGDIKITHISPAGLRTEVSLMKGLAVYTPNSIRTIKVPLTKSAAVNYEEGRLLVEYISQSSDKALLSKAEIAL